MRCQWKNWKANSKLGELNKRKQRTRQRLQGRLENKIEWIVCSKHVQVQVSMASTFFFLSFTPKGFGGTTRKIYTLLLPNFAGLNFRDRKHKSRKLKKQNSIPRYKNVSRTEDHSTCVLCPRPIFNLLQPRSLPQNHSPLLVHLESS